MHMTTFRDSQVIDSTQNIYNSYFQCNEDSHYAFNFDPNRIQLSYL